MGMNQHWTQKDRSKDPTEEKNDSNYSNLDILEVEEWYGVDPPLRLDAKHRPCARPQPARNDSVSFQIVYGADIAVEVVIQLAAGSAGSEKEKPTSVSPTSANAKRNPVNLATGKSFSSLDPP